MLEFEEKVKKDAKFEKFYIQPVPEAKRKDSEAPEGFRKVIEPEDDGDLSDVEKLNKRVKKEAEQAEAAMSATSAKAEETNG